ncbi:MAG: hypothetical protein R3A10_07375 [Caldilineaceae bacterium]
MKRTYSIGYESDPTIPWSTVCAGALAMQRCRAIWHLRRAGSFEQLSAQGARVILGEHGGIGRAYGRAGLGTDIRLACHGLDKNDNDFRGRPHRPGVAAALRHRPAHAQTKQTSLHLERLARSSWARRSGKTR